MHGLDDGSLALEIEEARDGPVGLSTWVLHWTDQRTGYLRGQGDGHQSHLRLYDGRQNFILYEGVNGRLTDLPGVSYAGVALVTGPDDSEPVVGAECEADATNRTLFENVRKLREAAAAPELASEDSDGPFEAWF